MDSVKASLRDVIREALEVLEYRDIVYCDPHAKKWKSSLKRNDVIETPFGEVAFVSLRAIDGVACGSHESGHAFLQGGLIVRNDEGNYCISSPASTSHDENAILPAWNEPPDEDIVPTPRGGKRDAIDLRGCFVEANDMRYLCSPLSGNYFVLKLNLSGNHLNDASAMLLAAAIGVNGALEELILSYNDINADGSIALVQCLKTNARLRHLDLSHNHIGTVGLRAWLTLKQNHTLEALLLSHNRDIQDNGGVDILHAISNEPLSLHDQAKLDLLVKSSTVKYLPDLLHEPSNASICMLSLSEVGLSTQSAKRLALVIETNQVLAMLDVSMNKFADESNLLIATALGQNKTLKRLHYAANPLCDAAAAAMAASLATHPALAWADFSGCFFGASAGTELAALLRHNQALTSLDLSGGNLDPPGIVALCKSIGDNTTLQTLELTSSGLKSDTVVAVLAHALEKNSTLTSLHLGYNKITLRGCKLLKDAIQANKTCKLTEETLLLEGNSGVKSKTGNVLIKGGIIAEKLQEKP
ncbi:unnamed protein product [Aphanomyces euteiches]|nr:hypothetical protein Ae201684P_013968 [Aphanomyces euteiches]KAH9140656.1 hypothetical protein AeRB84_015127 [Aphanomyces euteiches]